MTRKHLHSRIPGFFSMTVTRTFILAMIYLCVIGVPALMIITFQLPAGFYGIFYNPSILASVSVFILLAILAPYAYLFFQQKYDARRLSAQREQFNALKTITQGSLEIEDLGHLLKIIPNFLTLMYHAKLKTDIEQAAVYFYDAVTKSYLLVAHRGSVSPESTFLSTDNPLVFWFTKKAPQLVKKGYVTARDVQALRLDDIKYLLTHTNVALYEPSIKNLFASLRNEFKQLKADLCIPCFYQKECAGILILGEKERGRYNQEEIDALTTVSNHIAMAVRSARLRQELTSSYLEAITSIIKSLEARDPYTKGHADRVSSYSLAITLEVKDKSPFDQIVDLQAKVQQAALLHDVGKIGVRDGILLKPDGLNTEEIEVIRQHPQIGEHILSGLRGIPKDVLAGIRYHHEKFDGSGLAELKGERIPPIARILAVADSFDAMTTDRPYRKAMSDREAVKEIIKYTYFAGPQWDPVVVEGMLEAFKQGIFKKDSIITQQEIELIKKELAAASHGK